MLIVRYGEIGLKGRNRKKFEELLSKNIERKLKRYGYSASTKILRGRIFVYAPDESISYVAKCPGVVSVSPAREMDYEEIFPYLERELSNYRPKSFKVETQRVDKRYPKKSQEINEEVGGFIVEKFGWKVDLKNPELVVGIEVIDSKFYVFFERIPGVGGLPVGSAGKLVLLISPGIDSPVAGFLMLKRGAEIVALHMSHGEEGERRVREIVKVLSMYSPREIEIHILDHSAVLKDVASNLARLKKERWVCVFCKYTMVKMACDFAKKHGALGLVMGDSLGQVASQTLDNMNVVSRGCDLPIYRPLIGMDKMEIERIARNIGTYDLFLSWKELSCPFRPRYVVTNARVEEFERIRREIGV